MHADDTSPCHQSHNKTQLNEAINSNLKKLETWLQGNRLSLNVAKIHSMLISTKQKGSSLRSQNEALELKIQLVVVQKTKHLGVQIDCSLDWKVQINAVATKVSRPIGFLGHAKSFLPKANLKTLYTGIVEPTFDTVVLSWVVLGIQTSSSYKNFKIVLLGS